MLSGALFYLLSLLLSSVISDFKLLLFAPFLTDASLFFLSSFLFEKQQCKKELKEHLIMLCFILWDKL